jgi:hypothetical protein
MSRRHARAWYSRGLSNVYDAVRSVRDHDRERRVTLIASHTRKLFAAGSVADEVFAEPGQLSDADFVAWCLATCRERGVDLFVPGRRVIALAGARAAFEAAGTRLLVPAEPDALRRIERKDAFYEDLADQALPDHRIVSTADAFDAACAELGAIHPRLCVKPVVSTFGLGFHTLHADARRGPDDAYRRFLGGDGVAISFGTARDAIASARHPRPLMVMEYLPGPERSVDCLASDGALVCAVARLKRGDYQVLETAGPAVDAARAVIRRYRLDGLCNVQTRDGRGEARLLEANARMSGGLLYAAASGVAFPWWALQLALGWAAPADVPTPRAGRCVAPVQGMVVVAEEPVPERAPAPRPAGSRARSAATLPR